MTVSDRSVLTLACFGAMMLPYQVAFMLGLLVLTAGLAIAVEHCKKAIAWNYAIR